MKTLTTILTVLALTITSELVSAQGQWYNINMGTTRPLNSIDKATGNIYFAVGDSGTALRSVDGGLTWTQINTGTNRKILCVSFFNSTGILVDSYGSFYKTTDGGQTWVFLRSDYVYYNQGKVQMIDASNAFVAIGSIGFRTTDGGNNWAYVYVNSSTGFHFTDPLNGYMIDGTIIKKTTNGGLNWSALYWENNYTNFTSIYFVNNNTGYATTQYYLGNKIIKTTNGGVNWVQSAAVGSVLFQDIKFNGDFGFAVGYGNQIYKTVNGGVNWSIDSINNSSSYRSVCIKDINNAVAAGTRYTGYYYAAIIKYSGTTGINPVSNQSPDNFSLSQNYPNPFNPTTNIKFSIIKSTMVKLVVFDISGREVETLVNENMSPGSYNVDWNASKLSSGVYFYKLVTNELTDTKKMILNK